MASATDSKDDPDVELIAFENPSEARIFLPQIRWAGDKLNLLELLRSKFSKFGLLHHLFADRSKGQAGEIGADGFSNWFAAIDFFSTHSAKRAILFSHNNLCINRKPCKVISSDRKAKTSLPLALAKCEDLANYYLGFNGWNSEVIVHKLTGEERDSSSDRVTQTYLCAARLTFPGAGLEGEEVSVEAAGRAFAEFSPTSPADKCKAVAKARKEARNGALQNAFGKLLLVVVDGGRKISVHVNHERQECFEFEATWKDKGEVGGDFVQQMDCHEQD